MWQISHDDYFVPGWSELKSEPKAWRRLGVQVAGVLANAVLVLGIVWAIFFFGWFEGDTEQNDTLSCEARYDSRISSARTLEEADLWFDQYVRCVEHEEEVRRSG